MASTRIKKFHELTKELQDTIEKAKSDFLEKIINEPTLSKPEKLTLISINDLFGTKNHIQHIFSEYEEEFEKQLGGTSVIDDWFHMRDFERHYIVVYLNEELDYFEEYLEEDDTIVILSDRRTKKKFKISKYEFIDTIYDWCIKNKCIGFAWDY